MLRRVFESYRPHYERVRSRGLWRDLHERGLLVRHTEVAAESFGWENTIAVLEAERVPVISFAGEWCHSQLRDAALLTLEIQMLALSAGMTLVDAATSNVQFAGCQPLFVDSLSLKCRTDGEPWSGYQQFCRQFLGPLALSAYVGPEVLRTVCGALEGLSLPVISAMLPARSWFRPGLLVHLHLHSRAGRAGVPTQRQRRGISPASMAGLALSLRSAVAALKAPATRDVWSRYYQECALPAEYLADKESQVRAWLGAVQPSRVLDLGANTGRFSELAASNGARVTALDSAPECIEDLYRRHTADRTRSLLPLVADVASPSPPVGWALEERESLFDRCQADMVLFLGLIHHLAAGGNVPLERIADLLARLAPRVIVEFIPKDDPNWPRVLGQREDIFPDYGQTAWEAATSRHFEIRASHRLAMSKRQLYLLERK
jgi:SAM-dependent methyltransferase